MDFASIAWLAGVPVVAGVAVYLLIARRPKREVPFLRLWGLTNVAPAKKWKPSAPPPALALAIASLFLAILGAARPEAHRLRGGHTARLTLVVDRGITMSARGRHDLRFRELGGAALDEAARVFGPDIDITVITLPELGDANANASETQYARRSVASSAELLASLPPTAIDQHEALQQLLRRRLGLDADPILVVSDIEPDVHDPRIICVRPSEKLENVSVSLLSARALPAPQVMVRLRNDSRLASATLRVNFGGKVAAAKAAPTNSLPVAAAGGAATPSLAVAAAEAAPTNPLPVAAVSQVVNLPPRGTEQDYFYSAASLGDEISAEVVADDDLKADNRAWLLRESKWPLVELACPAGPLQRMLTVYRSLHPASPASARVRIVSTVDDLAVNESGVVLSPVLLDGRRTVRPTHIKAHPLTDPIRNWETLDLVAGDASPPDGWSPLVSSGNRVLVAEGGGAASGSPCRQVWINLDNERWADRPEYVIFWTALLDWLGGGETSGSVYASYPLQGITRYWHPQEAASPANGGTGQWPGIYRSEDGERRAFNIENFRTVGLPAGSDWRRSLNALRTTGTGWRDLSAFAYLGAVISLMVAAAIWTKSEGSERTRSRGVSRR